MTALEPAAFGAGGTEPWSALLGGGPPGLALVHGDGTADEHLTAERWFQPADRADRSALQRLAGPLLDVGCGPGRMVAAAIRRGLDGWGLDSSPAAIAHCRERGLPVLKRDLFDVLPREGAWGSVLLLDGNIGIGGDVRAILARCRTLLRPGGLLVAETDADRRRDDVSVCRVRDGRGGLSAPFPWAQAGSTAVVRAATGFDVDRVWRRQQRCFVRLRRA